MKLEQSFEVEAPLERVWEALVNVERVAPCLPGAAVTGRNDDGTYNGTFTIKIGPTTASYDGKLEMQNVDEASHSATMHAQGSDKRGQGGATATIQSRLSPSNGTTRVDVVTDYHITGRLARFGRGGMIEDISERLLREFAGRLQSSLAGRAAPSAAASADQPSVPPPTEAAPTDDVDQPTKPFEQVAAEAAAVPQPEGAVPPAPPEPEVAPPPPPPAAAEPPPPPPEPPKPPGAEPAAPPPPSPEPEATAPPPPSAQPAPPLDAGSLVGSVLIERVRRNPKPILVVAGGLIVLRMIRRRR
jgi:carbon monoxide dehydrogenase subunit G